MHQLLKNYDLHEFDPEEEIIKKADFLFVGRLVSDKGVHLLLEAFSEILEDMTSYVLNHKGEEVISERHQKDFKKEYALDKSDEDVVPNTSSFTDIDFDDI